MFLRALELAHFRSWKGLSARFDDRVTALLGPNGSGKTSIVEAAWYVASLRSHRSAVDAALVRSEEASAIVRADVEGGARVERVEVEVVVKGRARARLGGAPVARRRDVLGVLRAAIFGPERQAVVRGEPAERRDFADELLVQLHPRYHAVAREYERALRQRNSLLREHAAGRGSLEGLEAWDEALVAPGADICAGRARAIAGLAPRAADAFEAVGGGARLEVAYEPKVPWPSDPADVERWAASMRARIEERRELEVVRGTSLVGPHRDEVAMVIGGLPARTHASHGEGWLAALALTLGSLRIVADAIGEEPVLLLDDPFTLLDPERRARLVGALPRDAQILVTAADPAEIPVSLDAARVEVENLRAG